MADFKISDLTVGSALTGAESFEIVQGGNSRSQLVSAIDTYIGAAKTGTANRITVAAGVIDISGSYVGQASITTLGTIVTGVWHGTAVDAIYGGTGLTSTAKGSLVVGMAANQYVELVAGTNGKYLVTDSAEVSGLRWETPTAGNLTGPVTSIGLATTIGTGVVGLGNLADMATASLYYRKTAGLGAPEVNSLATLKTDLGLSGTNTGDQTSIVGITGNRTAFDAALTGDDFLYVGDVVGVTDGDKGDIVVSGTGTAWNVDTNALGNNKLAQVATSTIRGRRTIGVGDIEDMTIAQTKSLLAIVSTDISDFTEAAQDAVGAMVDGSLVYVDGTPLLQRAALTGDATAAAGSNSIAIANFVGDSGAGGVKGFVPAPAIGDATRYLKGDGTWGAIAGGGTVTIVSVVSANGFAGTVATDTTTPAITISTSINGVLKGNGTAISAAVAGTDYQVPITAGDVTTSGATSTIGANKVTLGMEAQIATASFKGRVTAATGNVEVLTGTQATTLLDVFTSALKGLVPLSGGGTTNFLRADGTWAAAGGSGGGISLGLANATHLGHNLI